MNKVEGKVSDWCPKCKNCKGQTRESNGVHDWLTEVECEDPYDGMIQTLDADSDIRCSMFEERKEKEPFNLNIPREAIKAIAKLNDVICELEKEKAAHLKGIERLKKTQEKLQNQVKNLQTTNEESYKREEKLEDKCHKLERRFLEEKRRFDRLDNEFLIPLVHVLYHGEKVCKPYSEILTDIKLLNKGTYDLKEDNKRLAEKNKSLENLYGDIHYALYKDMSLDESISCPRDIPSDVEMIEDLKKRAADSDYYKEKSELLKEKLKKANELADSWKRDYERIRDQFIYPIYNILYPDKPDLDINVTDFLNDIKDLKVYSEENGQMYKEIQEWREKCIARGNDIDHLLSENKEKDKKISELEKLYNSLSETCADYDKRCKEECEKKYRDEISKLQNIVTEKHVEIKGLKKEIINLTFDRATVKDIMKKNIKFKETISDQEVTIKALLITIKEMCKEDETNE